MSNSNDDFTEISTKKQEYFKRYIVYFYRNIALFFAFSGLVSFIFSQEPLVSLINHPASFIILLTAPFLTTLFFREKIIVISFNKANRIFYLLSGFIGILTFLLFSTSGSKATFIYLPLNTFL